MPVPIHPGAGFFLARTNGINRPGDAERRGRLGNLIRWRDDFRDKVLGSARSL